MSDYSLPQDDDTRRKLLVGLYKKDIAEAARLAELNVNVDEPKEIVTRSAREAMKMAFELYQAGEYTQEEWKKEIEPFDRYKPVRATYQRSSDTLEALAETAANQKESVLQ